MKNIFFYTFLFSALISKAQLLTNEGFEGTYVNTAPGWNEITWGNSTLPQVDYQCETMDMHGGNAAQKIIVHDLGDGATMIKQDYDFSAGNIYEAHIWLKSDIPMRVKFMFQERIPYYFVPAAFVALTDTTWQEFTIKGGYRRNTANDQVLIQGRVVVQPLDTGMLLVDDASFSDITLNEWNSPVADTGIIPASFFGMHINKLGVHQTYPAVNSGTMRLWSTGTEWSAIEPIQGILTDPANWMYDSTGASGFGFRLDYYTDFIRTHDSLAEIIYTMGQTPSWAATYPDMPPANISDWQNYVSILGNRYNNKIKNWEVWNEADYTGFYSGTTTELIALSQIAFTELKNINPANKVLAPNFTSAEGLANYLSAGGSVYADVISWHHYFSKAPEESIAEIAGIKNVMDNYNVAALPLWNTEGAVSFPSADTLSAEEGMAAVSRSLILQRAFGIHNFNWFCWDVFQDFAHRFVELSYSATPNQYDSITVAGIAYRETARWLTGARMRNKNVVNDQWTIEMELSDGTAAWIVWSTTGIQSFSIPGAWNVTQQDDLYGNSTPVISANIFIGPLPVLLRSGIVSVQNKFHGDDLSIYPNPSDGLIYIRSSNSNLLSAAISNVLGATLLHTKLSVSPGRYEAIIDARKLAPGIYFITLTTLSGVKTQKLILEK